MPGAGVETKPVVLIVSHNITACTHMSKLVPGLGQGQEEHLLSPDSEAAPQMVCSSHRPNLHSLVP